MLQKIRPTADAAAQIADTGIFQGIGIDDIEILVEFPLMLRQHPVVGFPFLAKGVLDIFGKFLPILRRGAFDGETRLQCGRILIRLQQDDHVIDDRIALFSHQQTILAQFQFRAAKDIPQAV